MSSSGVPVHASSVTTIAPMPSAWLAAADIGAGCSGAGELADGLVVGRAAISGEDRRRIDPMR
ncbi:MAG: hypothetical protein ACFHWZ_08920 [Phycisphaerales bacterium]